MGTRRRRHAHRDLALALLVGTALAGCASPPSWPDGDSQDGQAWGRMHRHRATDDDTLVGLARLYDVGYTEMRVANPGVDPWLPPPGAELTIPTAHLLPDVPREGVVVNLAEQRLYLFERDAATQTFPIGISRAGWSTPLGTTRVVRKQTDPTWYPPASARREDPTLEAVVRPGPDNPLGAHALYLGWERYLIHGTNEPDGVGRRVSRGCIRLYPEDIERLYAATAVGTPVRVISQPVKLAWVNDELYLEVHPTLDQVAQLEEHGRFEPDDVPDLRERVSQVAGERAGRVDWERVAHVVHARRGVPVRVTRPLREPGWLEAWAQELLSR